MANQERARLERKGGARGAQRPTQQPPSTATATDRRGARGARREDREKTWRDAGGVPTRALLFGVVDGEDSCAAPHSSTRRAVLRALLVPLRALRVNLLSLRCHAGSGWEIGAPPRVGKCGWWSVRPHVRRVDRRLAEILGWDGGAGEPPQHRELARVRHRVAERTLEETLVGHRRRERRVAEVGVHGREGVVEARHLVGEAGQSRRQERSVMQGRPRKPITLVMWASSSCGVRAVGTTRKSPKSEGASRSAFWVR